MEQHQADNYSIDCYRQCPKLYYWRILRELVKPGVQKTAAEFGTALHIALETYYGGDAKVNEMGVALGSMTPIARDASIIAALEYFAPFEVEGEEKRTSARLAIILEKYFTRYAHEPFNVIATEVGGAFELDANWVYTTRLDLLVEWQNPRGIYVFDHKTTYDLGSLIAKPHNQLTGYVANVTEMYENVLGAVLDGVGVYATDDQVDKTLPKVPSEKTGKLVYAKKPREFFQRIPTQRSQRELAEWRGETLHYLHQIEECVEGGVWPKHAPDTCVKYKSRCAYIDLCNTDPETAERMIAAGVYMKQPWSAYKHAGEDVEE